MTGRGWHRHVAAFVTDQRGAAMVEFAIVCLVFFISLFQLFDFGLFASNNLMAEKATQLAARIAVTRPPACSGVPDRINASALSPAPRYGTNCRNATGTCAAVTTASCAGVATNATASEIWTRISPMLPSDVVIGDLQFTYTFDDQLGYLGGPYTPMVTVELTLNDFSFVSPITEWAIFGSGNGTHTMSYRTISISLPGEDLALGTNG